MEEVREAAVGRRKGSARACENFVGWKDVRPTMAAKMAKIKKTVEEKEIEEKSCRLLIKKKKKIPSVFNLNRLN